MSRSKLFGIIFFAFFVSTLLIPVAVVNKLCFLFLLAIIFIDFDVNRKLYTTASITIALIFLYGFIVSLFFKSDSNLRTQFLLSISVLFLINPLVRYKIDLDRIVKMGGVILLLYTGLFYFILLVIPGVGSSSFLLDLFEKYGGGAFGTRSFTDEGVFNFQLGTTPFLYLPLALYLKDFIRKKNVKDFFLIILFLIAIGFSGLRGLAMSSILVGLFLFYINLKIPGRIFFMFVLVSTLLVLVPFILQNTYLFSSEEESNTVKLGHAESILDNMTFVNLITGEGLASYYFSKGPNKLVAHTEITPFDMFRYFGIIFFLLLYLRLIFPTLKLESYKKDNFLNLIIFLIYIINSFTNPILFNSYGLLIVLWYWSKILTQNRVLENKDILI